MKAKSTLPALHIVGSKNSGKTRLLQWLIKQLTDCGLKVGALKHSMHEHPIDKPGSDSDVLRKAGAHPAAFWSNEGLAIFYPPQETEQGWEILNDVFTEVDLLLIESFGSALGPKIIIEDGSNRRQNVSNIIAYIAEPPFKTDEDVPVFGKNDAHLIPFILDYFNLKCKSPAAMDRA